MTQNLTKRTLHGLKWSYAGTAINAVAQVGFTATMARLLDPAAFGLVAMANVVLRFGSYFAQLGVGSALVQKAELSTQEIRAAFTSSLSLGLLFALATFLFAPLSLLVFDNPDLVKVVRVMSLSFLLGSLSTTSLSLLRRGFEFKRITFVESASYIFGYAFVGITLGILGFGVWSLVAATLSQSFFSAVLSYSMSRHPVAFARNWKHYTLLFSFGRKVSVIGFLEFVSFNLDTIAIGRLFDAASLGLYNRAYMLINLPMQMAVTSFTRVIVPSFSRIQSETTRVGQAYLSSATLLAAFVIPACITVAAASRETVQVVLGERWLAAAVILQVLAFMAPLNLLSHLCGVVFEATAVLRPKIVIQVFQILLLCVLIIALRSWGIIGIAVAVGISEFARHTAYIYVTHTVLRLPVNRILLAYRPGLISGVAVGLGVYSLSVFGRWMDASAWLIFLGEYLLAFTILIVLLVITDNSVRKELAKRLSRLEMDTDRGDFLARWLRNISGLLRVR